MVINPRTKGNLFIYMYTVEDRSKVWAVQLLTQVWHIFVHKLRFCIGVKTL